MRRGSSGGFRVLAYFDKRTKIIQPICVYTKQDYAKEPGEQPAKAELKRWLASLSTKDSGDREGTGE